jgi:hypothetical protein
MKWLCFNVLIQKLCCSGPDWQMWQVHISTLEHRTVGDQTDVALGHTWLRFWMLEHAHYNITGRMVVTHVDIVLQSNSVSWPVAKRHRYQMTTFPLQFSVIYQMTMVSNRPELFGYCIRVAALYRSMYQIKVHEGLGCNRGDEAITFL